MKWLCALVLPALMAIPSAAQTEPPAPGATISVDVNLVVLHVTVRNRKGELVSGLQESDFQVFEDGKPQVIRVFQHEDVPVSVGLIVDNSGSMARKRADVAAAALTFAHASNPRDQMFVVNFNEHVSLGLPPSELFSASPEELVKALNGVPASGMTALYDAIEFGLAHVKKANLDKKVLIVISDGGDDASRHTLSQVLADAERSNVIIYTVGLFDPYEADQNPGVLKQIARATGGEAYFPETSAGVVPVCKRIAEDIRSQYTIAYLPSNAKLDNTYRTIKVKVSAPHEGKLVARARAGYIAAGPEEQGPQP